jgi:hypothetical protein
VWTRCVRCDKLSRRLETMKLKRGACMPRCPTCGLEAPYATISRGYCSPACWPEAQAAAAARRAEAEAARKAKSKRTEKARENGRTSKRRAGRFLAMNAFLDFSIATAKLTPAQALVWLVLFRDTKPDGLARTSQNDIARRCNLSPRTVKLALRVLRAKGFVEVVHRGHLRTGPSAYRVYPTARMG